MFTVPSTQSESNLLALSQAKNFSTQMKNHSHASRIPSLDQSPYMPSSAEWKTPLCHAQHHRLSRYTYRPPPRSGRYGKLLGVGNGGSQKVECTKSRSRNVPGTQNDREDRAIRRVATSAPTTSLASIQRHLPPSRHPVPSRETIRRRLTEVGLRSRRPLRRLTTDPHIIGRCRLDFCRPRATWSVTD
ncbi:hypothetical protein TNCV_1957851 [Trichonephila clavipes]|nr:hypothetical protein TNCV_1957851 [Trichonephila clavipes]